MPTATHPAATTVSGTAPFSIYVHIPFCAVRCGYCDFNTYAPAERLGLAESDYVAAVLDEIRLARSLLSRPRTVQTVFFGGGTPTLLPSSDLVRILAELRTAFDFEAGAEVTVEANPESVSEGSLAQLREGGFTRLSLGMQSASPRVLRTLDRQHSPGRALAAVGWAKNVGFDSVNLDLIYGTPGESVADWRSSVSSALSAEPDHVSAYSLIVEPGTRMSRAVNRGALVEASQDELADKYELADDLFSAAGLYAYEVSNWAKPGFECRHNLAYWHSDDWWGFGAGAHGHLGVVRWWNVKNPRTYVQLAATNPAQGSEVLTEQDQAVEDVLLRLRLSEGLELNRLPEPSRAERVVQRGLGVFRDGRLVLNRRGLLLADAIVRELL